MNSEAPFKLLKDAFKDNLDQYTKLQILQLFMINCYKANYYDLILLTPRSVQNQIQIFDSQLLIGFEDTFESQDSEGAPVYKLAKEPEIIKSYKQFIQISQSKAYLFLKAQNREDLIQDTYIHPEILAEKQYQKSLKGMDILQSQSHFRLRYLKFYMREGTKQCIFNYLYDKSINIRYDSNLSSFQTVRNFYPQLFHNFQKIIIKLQQPHSDHFILLELVISLKYIHALHQLQLSNDHKLIILAFIYQIFEHFLFCETLFKDQILKFIENHIELFTTGQYQQLKVTLRRMLDSYNQLYKKDITILKLLGGPEKINDHVSQLYFKPESIYLYLKQEKQLSLNYQALITQQFYEDLHALKRNQLIVNIFKIISLQINQNLEEVEGPLSNINHNTTIEQLITEFNLHVYDRIFYMRQFDQLDFLLSMVNDCYIQFHQLKQSGVLDNENNLRSLNEELIARLTAKGTTAMSEFQLFIFSQLQDKGLTLKKQLYNNLLFYVSVIYPQFLSRLIAIILYQYYSTNYDSSYIKKFTNYLHHHKAIDSIILTSLKLLDKIAQDKVQNNEFSLHYRQLKFDRLALGKAYFALSRFTDAIYQFEYYLSETQFLYQFEQKVIEEEYSIQLRMIIEKIHYCYERLNYKIDLNDSCKRLGLDQIKKELPLHKKLNISEQLKTFKVFECHMIDLVDHMKQGKIIITKNIYVVKQLLLQLVCNFANGQDITDQFEYVKLILAANIIQSENLLNDNAYVIKSSKLISNFQDMLNYYNTGQEVVFQKDLPQFLFLYFMFHIKKRNKNRKAGFIQYKLEYCQYLYYQRKYEQALQYCDQGMDSFFLAKIHAKMNNFHIAKEILAVKQGVVKFEDKISLFKTSIQCQNYIRQLKYTWKSGFYQQKIIKLYSQVYEVRDSQPFKTYFIDKKSNFMYFFQSIIDVQCNCGEPLKLDQIKNCKFIFDLLLECILEGKQKIAESFPKLFRLWFDHSKINQIQRDNEIFSTLQYFQKQFNAALPKINTGVLSYSIDILISAVETFRNDKQSTQLIIQAIAKLAQEFPQQLIWWLGPLKNFNQTSQHKIEAYSKAIQQISNSQIQQQIISLEKQFQVLLQISMQQYTQEEYRKWTGEKINRTLIQLYDNNPEKLIYPSIDVLTPPFSKTKPLVKIVQIMQQMEIAPTKARPKKITVKLSNDELKNLLLKQEDVRSQVGDTRREQRIVYLIQYLNSYIGPFNIPIFSTLCLNQLNQLVEWVDNTITLKSLISDNAKIRANGRYSESQWIDLAKKQPMLNEKWFQIFPNPEIWHETQLNFIQSMAAWSTFQYLIGFGDRHCDNILLDKQTGQLIHIDFECVFHKGRTLPVPEIVDFRLTKNFRYGMGFLLEQGLFKKYFKQILNIFRINKQNILAFLDPYIYDPLLCSTATDMIELISRHLDLTDEKMEKLIEYNKNDIVLKQMYTGWAPYL